MRRIFLLLNSSLILLSIGCQKNDDQIQTYRVSKESAPAMPMAAAPMMGSNPGPAMGGSNPPPMMGNPGGNPGQDMQSMGAGMGMAPAASSRDIEWKLPSGWQDQPPSSMRVGSFLAKGSNGQAVDISVVPLSGEAGGDLSNINRWRGQINLEPISDADLPQNSKTITPAGRSMLWVDIVSREPLVDNKYPKRLIAAVYKQGNRTWFFKMTGEDKAVEETKPTFLQFLKSLRFHGNA